MNDLIDKFKNDSISKSEMINLRENISACSDEELNQQLERASSQFSFSELELENLENRISQDIKSTTSLKKWVRILSGVAAIIIPLLIIATVVIVKGNSKISEYDSLLAKKITISTSKGENTNYTLPDGSMVILRPMSNLSYTLRDFNNTGREISFSGEATFEVSRDKKRPFTLCADGFKINVLGTCFSVTSRKNNNYAEVFLKNGSIVLSSDLNNSNIQLIPGQKALINTITGDIDVSTQSKTKQLTGQNFMKYYESVSLQDINSDLNLYFNQNILINENLKSITFTGMLPTDSFEETRKILESTMGISFKQINPTTWIIE